MPTRDEVVTDIKDYMDATNSDKWGSSTILSTLDSVFDSEWSRILGAAPYYRFAQRSVTTAADGTFPLTDLNSGTGDSQQLWYRIISITDGNYVFAETRFQDVPTAISSNYRPVWDRLYYFAGDSVQLLPAATTALTVAVNYKPTAPSALADGSSTVDFPANSHLILAWETAGRLLVKGGEETQAAADMFKLAEAERDKLLSDIQRRSIAPVRLMPPDSIFDWASR